MDLTGHAISLRGRSDTVPDDTDVTRPVQTSRRLRRRRRRPRRPSAAALALRRDQAGDVAAGVVDPHDERPGLGVADDRDRAGSTTIRWNWSRCRPSASARIALMTSPWVQASQVASGPELARSSRGRRRRRGSASAPAPPLRAGEHRGRRVLLHDLPQRVLGQLLERPAGPVAVPALAQPVVGLDLELAAGRDGAGGLPAAVQRAGDDRGERHLASRSATACGLGSCRARRGARRASSRPGRRRRWPSSGRAAGG